LIVCTGRGVDELSISLESKRPVASHRHESIQRVVGKNYTVLG